MKSFRVFIVFEEVNLAALVLSDPVVGCRGAVPTQCDNQDLGLRIQQPLYLVERQLVCLGDLAGSAVSTNLEV